LSQTDANKCSQKIDRVTVKGCFHTMLLTDCVVHTTSGF